MGCRPCLPSPLDYRASARHVSYRTGPVREVYSFWMPVSLQHGKGSGTDYDSSVRTPLSSSSQILSTTLDPLLMRAHLSVPCATSLVSTGQRTRACYRSGHTDTHLAKWGADHVPQCHLEHRSSPETQFFYQTGVLSYWSRWWCLLLHDYTVKR